MTKDLTKNKYDGALTAEEIDALLAGIHAGDVVSESFKTIEEFHTSLTERHQPEKQYGYFSYDITMSRFFESENGENILADIERKYKEQGMGNFQLPNTNIKLINYSVCPKCKHIFSFKDLTDYYSNPKPDKIFKNRAEQHREDTRVLCKECNTYFLPALVIADGTSKMKSSFFAEYKRQML